MIFLVAFTVAFLVGKVLEMVFKEKELDLGGYIFWAGFAAFASLYWVYTSFSAK